MESWFTGCALAALTVAASAGTGLKSRTSPADAGGTREEAGRDPQLIKERERESDLGRSMQGTKLTRLRAQNIATVSKSFMNTHLFSFS